MKLSRYSQRFEDATMRVTEAYEILKNIDGTDRKKDVLIDLACAMITEFEQIQTSYIKLARVEAGIFDNVITTKEQSKMDRLYDMLLKFDFISKGYKAIKQGANSDDCT